MQIREHTKYAFAEAIKTLLLTKDLPKIRVTELCDMCGAERPTFYYHFRDKHDLIAWIYMKDFEQSVADNGGVYNQQQLTRLMYRVRQQERFYKKVFAEQTQNALSNYIIRYNVQNTENIVKQTMGTDTLSREIRFSIQFFVNAWVSSLIQWVTDPNDLSAEEFVALVYQNFPKIMTDTYTDVKLVDL